MSVLLAPTSAQAPFAAPTNFGTISNDVAAGIFARQSQADLDACIGYCNRKWPGNADCIRDCHDIAYSAPKGIADSSDFFAGAISETQSAASDITDLYSQVTTPDWARNTGINHGGEVVNTPVILPSTSSQAVESSPSTSSVWLYAGGAVVLAALAWMAFSK